MIKTWNTLKVAGWGAALGLLYSAVTNVLEGKFKRDEDHLAYFTGGLGGGALGGAILFAAVFGTRNMILKVRRSPSVP